MLLRLGKLVNGFFVCGIMISGYGFGDSLNCLIVC